MPRWKSLRYVISKNFLDCLDYRFGITKNGRIKDNDNFLSQAFYNFIAHDNQYLVLSSKLRVNIP